MCHCQSAIILCNTVKLDVYKMHSLPITCAPRHTRAKKCIIVVIFFMSLAVFYYSSSKPRYLPMPVKSTFHQPSSAPHVHQQPRHVADDSKLILFLDFPDFYELANIQGPGGLAKCNSRDAKGREMKCQVTLDKGKLGQADAVLFYSHNKVSLTQFGSQPVKAPGTTWTFFAVESPIYSNNKAFGLPSFHDKFNSTMTYRTDSEFWHGYIRSQRRAQPLSASERKTEEQQLRAAFRNKTKTAAIFVSHCGASSKRHKYLQELKKHLDLDVYGACGTLRCQDRVECDKMVNRDYKFYLAFENSLCLDYVTEKLLRVMKSKRVVPIVRSGADYGRLFPKNSVVDTAGFETPAKLAEHIRALSSNEDEWVKMFHWTWDWEVKGPDLPFCQYCHSLYNRSSHLYHNVYDWWAKGTCYPVKDVNF